MMTIVRFQQGHKILTAFTCPLEKAEHHRDCVAAAFEQFYKEYPGISLLDSVTVTFDKMD